MIQFNHDELSTGIESAIEIDEKKKNEVSMFSKIFKMVITAILLLSIVQYVLYGPDAFKMAKVKNM